MPLLERSANQKWEMMGITRKEEERVSGRPNRRLKLLLALTGTIVLRQRMGRLLSSKKKGGVAPKLRGGVERKTETRCRPDVPKIITTAAPLKKKRKKVY